MDAMRQTDIVGAGGDESLVYTVMAEVAFLGDAFVFIKCDGIVGAGIDTRLTTGAQIVIHDDNVVLSFADSFLRTGFGTRGIITVAAPVDLKDKIQFSVNQSGSILLN
jgi:hypothetical protein